MRVGRRRHAEASRPPRLRGARSRRAARSAGRRAARPGGLRGRPSGLRGRSGGRRAALREHAARERSARDRSRSAYARAPGRAPGRSDRIGRAAQPAPWRVLHGRLRARAAGWRVTSREPRRLADTAAAVRPPRARRRRSPADALEHLALGRQQGDDGAERQPGEAAGRAAEQRHPDVAGAHGVEALGHPRSEDLVRTGRLHAVLPGLKIALHPEARARILPQPAVPRDVDPVGASEVPAARRADQRQREHGAQFRVAAAARPATALPTAARPAAARLRLQQSRLRTLRAVDAEAGGAVHAARVRADDEPAAHGIPVAGAECFGLE